MISKQSIKLLAFSGIEGSIEIAFAYHSTLIADFNNRLVLSQVPHNTAATRRC